MNNKPEDQNEQNVQNEQDNQNWQRDYTIEGEEPKKQYKHPCLHAFMERYSYDSMKMFVDQVAIAIFGVALAFAAGRADNDTLIIWSSVASILFYMFLLYIVAWQAGSRDSQSVRLGKMKYSVMTPLIISLIANIPNIFLALMYCLGRLTGVDVILAIGRVGTYLLEGMYTGILAIPTYSAELIEDSVFLRDYWFMYFVIIIPSMLMSVIAYTLGVKNVQLTKMMNPQLPESDRPSKAEIKERKRQNKGKKQ